MKKFIQYIVVSAIVLFSSVAAQAQSIKEAQKFMRNEMYEDADKVLKELITAKPKDHQPYYLLGLNHSTRGDYDQAMKVFQEGLVNAPKCKINQVGVGYVKLMKGNTDGARQDFDAALAQSKKKLKAELNREVGRAYINKGNEDEKNSVFWGKMAEQYLGNSRALKPSQFETTLLYGDAYMLSRKSDASKATEQYILASQLNESDPIPLIKQADVFRRAGNPEVAKTYAEEAIAKDENFAPAYRVMGSILSDLKQNTKALEYFEEYLKRNNNLSARRAYVSSLYLNGKYDEAIAEGKALLEKKDFANVYGVIALAHVSADKKDIAYNQEGLRYFELWELKEFKPKNKVLGQYELFQKASLLQRTGQFDAAEGLYLESIKDTSETKAALIESVANIMYQNENYVKYVELMELKVVKNGFSTLNDKVNLGSGYSKTGQYSKALASYKSMLKDDSTNYGAYNLIARTIMQTDTNDVSGDAQMNYTKWINSFSPEKYIENKSKIKESYQILAGAAQRRKDWTGMLNHFKSIVSVDPEDENAIETLGQLEKYVARLNASQSSED
ncbi:MAG: tetratricopeptide repeat protein [Bacteroidia bacterium]|nr:tetratricopeptide repeat protein [Bacteroidia bacterium]